MRLVTFKVGSEQHIGAVLDGLEQVSDFTQAEPRAGYFKDMLSLIDSGAVGLDHARSLCERPKVALRLSEIRLCAPLPEPRQMRDFLCFEQHIRQARANRYLVDPTSPRRTPSEVDIPATWYELPVYYKCNRFSVIGPDEA